LLEGGEMEKEKDAVVELGVVLAAVLVIVSLGFMVPAYARASEWHVYPGDSIQAAVDAATSGDTIYVHPGFRTIYKEEIRINKSVTIIAVEEWVQTGWDPSGAPSGWEMKPQLVGNPNIFVITDCSEWSYLSVQGEPLSAASFQREGVPALTSLGVFILIVLLTGIVAGRISKRR
jgi:hypothetical protein